MFKRPTNEQIITIIGGVFFFGFVFISWLPKPCPILKKALTICSTPHRVTVKQTPEEVIIASVAHQDISNDGYFATHAQDNRENTTVNFEYAGDLDTTTAYLAVNKKDGYHFIALITQPLMTTLNWSKIRLPEFTIYQRTPQDFTTTSAFLQHLPPAANLAVDSGVALQLQLKPSEYTSLESLTTLDGIQTILSTYSTAYTKDTWHSFSEKFDLTDAAVTKDNKLEWHISFLQSPDPKKPFHLGTVHVDYGQIFQKKL
jgi:hypothetical protein